MPMRLVFLLCCTAFTVAADSSFPDIQRILDDGKLRVAILARDAPPVIMTDEDGAPSGFEVEHALDIGKKMGVAVEFIRTAETYDGVVDLVARKEADLGVSFLTGGVQRAKKALFSQPYVIQTRRVFYNRARLAGLRRDFSVQTMEQLAATPAAETLTFGALEGSIYPKILQWDLPQFQLKLYQSLPELVTAVQEGQILAGLHGEVQLEFHMRENPETAIYIGLEPEVRNPSDISIAVRPDAPNLLRWVNVYLDNHVGLLDTATVIERFEESRAASK